MPFETDRLLLTPLRPGDERWLWPFMSDPVTMWAWPVLFDQAGVAAWIARSLEAERAFGFGRRLIRLRSDGRVLGECGFLPWQWRGERLIDSGWIIDRRYWRQGFAREAMRAMLPALRTADQRPVWAKMAADNEASWRMAEALGFTSCGEFRYERNRWARTRLYRRLH